MTRVLFATRAWESPEIEGGYLLLKDIARTLGAHDIEGFEACFFAMRDGEEDGVQLCKAYRGTGWGTARRMEFFRGLLKHLRRVDVVHFAHTPTRLNALLIRGLRKLYPNVRFIQTITGFEHAERDSHVLYWGDVLCTISLRVQQRLLTGHGMDADLITPHPSPRRLSQGRSLPGDLQASTQDAPLVVFPVDVFRLDLGQFDIAAVCSEILERHPNARLLFLDRFGEESRIRDRLGGLPDHQLIFLPVIDFMPALIRRADVVALPMSDIDGKFNPPMVLLEAAYFMRPMVFSDNIDLPELHRAVAVSGWNADDWAAAIGAALDLQSTDSETATGTAFERNCYRYLAHYRANFPASQAVAEALPSVPDFVAQLDAWAREHGFPVFHRADAFKDVDLTGRQDVDIWIRAADANELLEFLNTTAATRIIHRRATHWTSQDVFIVRVAEGRLQLDVGIGTISSRHARYARLDDFESEPGLVELPADVEIFARGIKRQMRGQELPASFPSIDDTGRQRLASWLGCETEVLAATLEQSDAPRRMQRLIAVALRRSFLRALSHPVEFLRVGWAKVTLPGRPAPFGRRIRGQIIAIIGTDGSGKSTTQALLRASLEKDGYRPRYVYMGRARGNAIVPSGLKDKAERAYTRSGAAWMKYLASWVYLFDYLARFARVSYLKRIRGETILCDRYYFDIQLMERYSRLAYRLLRWLAPKPDVLAVLDCEVATLMSRKAERTPAEYERQRQFYLDVAADARVRLWRGILDTDSLDRESIEEIISSLVYRASHRGLDY